MKKTAQTTIVFDVLCASLITMLLLIVIANPFAQAPAGIDAIAMFNKITCANGVMGTCQTDAR